MIHLTSRWLHPHLVSLNLKKKKSFLSWTSLCLGVAGWLVEIERKYRKRHLWESSWLNFDCSNSVAAPGMWISWAQKHYTFKTCVISVITQRGKKRCVLQACGRRSPSEKTLWHVLSSFHGSLNVSFSVRPRTRWLICFSLHSYLSLTILSGLTAMQFNSMLQGEG